MTTKEMRKSFIFCCLMLILGGCLVLGPDPKVVDEGMVNLLLVKSYHWKIRNKGAAGDILFLVEEVQGDRSWSKILYFEANEERQVEIYLPGDLSSYRTLVMAK